MMPRQNPARKSTAMLPSRSRQPRRSTIIRMYSGARMQNAAAMTSSQSRSIQGVANRMTAVYAPQRLES
jgi:hypothetical protein